MIDIFPDTKFSPGATQAFGRVEGIARQYNHPEIRAEHLLLSLTQDPLANLLLSKVGISRERVVWTVEEHLPTEAGFQGNLEIAPSYRWAVEEGIRMAEHNEDVEVTTPRLVAGIYASLGLGARNLLGGNLGNTLDYLSTIILSKHREVLKTFDSVIFTMMDGSIPTHEKEALYTLLRNYLTQWNQAEQNGGLIPDHSEQSMSELERALENPED